MRQKLFSHIYLSYREFVLHHLSKNNAPQTFIFLKLIVPIVILFLLVSNAGAENIEGRETDLISKIINAYGGKDQLSKVGSISADGHITKYFPDDKGTYYRHMTRERKLFVEIRYSKLSEKRILNGTNGYRGINDKIEKVTGPPYDAMVYQYNQLDLPFGLIDGSFKTVESRKDNLDGTDVEILRLKDRYGYEIDAYVGMKDYLIRRVVGYFPVGNSTTSLAAEFMDLRKVDGILLPFKIINYSRDSKLSETEITAYKINPKRDDPLFNP
jgi:hypothetical protein